MDFRSENVKLARLAKILINRHQFQFALCQHWFDEIFPSVRMILSGLK